MTTEEKALALVNAVTDSRADDIDDFSPGELRLALLAAIEAHEADKKAFSDACNKVWDLDSFGREQVRKFLSPFILPEPEPEPLVELAREMTLLDGVVRTDSQKAAIREGRAGNTASDDFYDRLRTALASRQYEVRKIGEAK